MEAGVVDSGAVAAEHGDGVRRRAAAGPLDTGHLAPVRAGSNRTERLYSLPLTRRVVHGSTSRSQGRVWMASEKLFINFFWCFDH